MDADKVFDFTMSNHVITDVLLCDDLSLSGDLEIDIALMLARLSS